MSVTRRPSMRRLAGLFARWHLGSVAVILHLGVAHPAYAALPSGVILSWDAPPGCADAAFIETRVSAILGETSKRAAHVQVLAHVEQVPAGFRLDLETREGASRRQQTFEDSSCIQLAETASVVIALVVRDASTTEDTPTGAPAPPPPIAPETPDEDNPVAAPEPGEAEPQRAAADPGKGTAASAEQLVSEPQPDAASRRGAPGSTPRREHRQPIRASRRPTPPVSPRRVPPTSEDKEGAVSGSGWEWSRGFLQVGALGDLGTLPGPALGMELGLRLEWKNGAGLVVGGVLLPKVGGTSTAPPGVEGEFQLAAGALGACRVTRSHSAAVHGCVGLELGELQAEAVGTDWSSASRELWLAPTAKVGGELAQGPVAIVASAGIAVPLIRKEYVIDKVGTIHQPHWVAGRLVLGAGYQF